MPEGYNPVDQVMINTFVNYWIPTYWPHGVVALLALLGVPAMLVARARRRRGAAG
jgi:hypothetical protein